MHRFGAIAPIPRHQIVNFRAFAAISEKKPQAFGLGLESILGAMEETTEDGLI